jgi:NAD(P)H-hydrate epimerase
LRSEKGFVYLTAEEMAEADRVAIEEYGIDVLALMENAGRSVAVLAMRMLGGEVAGREICCLAGKGNNGGDGLVAARYLSNWGGNVKVVLAGERSSLKAAPARQAGVVQRMGMTVGGPDQDIGKAELVIDALLGYSSRGNPREPVAGLIRRANKAKAPILAVDIPSGMDATTGAAGDPCIAARATVTFGFPKTGFLNRDTLALTGELYLADISLPRKIYSARSARGMFEKETIVRIR